VLLGTGLVLINDRPMLAATFMQQRHLQYQQNGNQALKTPVGCRAGRGDFARRSATINNQLDGTNAGRHFMGPPGWRANFFSSAGRNHSPEED
jgi:hypothetical protein